jgi:hypothetical protein
MNAKLEQRAIKKFPRSKKSEAVEIHCRLFQVFQEDEDQFSRFYELIRAFKTECTSMLDEDRAERPRFNQIDSKS